MNTAVIVDAKRTAIGRFLGALSTIRPDDLASMVIKAVLPAELAPALVDEVFFGCANQAGEDNRNIARMSLLLAGLPHSVPGVTLNRLCASGLEAVNQGARMIQVGDAKLTVCGGVESMSRAPFSSPRGPQHPKAGNLTMWDTSLGWRYPNPRLQAMFPLEAMGCTAENIVERMNISRQDQDEFALHSHQKALAAQRAGHFDKEILTVEVPQRRGPATLFSKDEGPRPGSTLEKLSSLRAAFRKGGSVTAGNSSTLNDGAAALLIADEQFAKDHGLPIRARIRAMASAGVDPEVMGLGPVPATQKALKRAGWLVEDVDVWELNEAFAAQSLGVIRSLNLPVESVNRNGGAIALGHPLGCSGARILTTLLHIMERENLSTGAATLCVGVGQGVTTLIERV